MEKLYEIFVLKQSGSLEYWDLYSEISIKSESDTKKIKKTVKEAVSNYKKVEVYYVERKRKQLRSIIKD